MTHNNFNILFSIHLFFLFSIQSKAQVIPLGDSDDTIVTSDGLIRILHIYKPPNYNPNSSPMIFTIHGGNGTGEGDRETMREIANHRKALFVGPDFNAGHPSWGYTKIETITSYWGENTIRIHWSPPVIKDIYRYIIARENRESMDVFLTGFSAGGQAVTRYMLLRQVFCDSIPLRMAVSASPCFYSFATDTLNGICMPWPCGLGEPFMVIPYYYKPAYIADFICHEHILQYYNENYGILIGTADNGCGGSVGGCQCVDAQGSGRYERAVNFKTFSSVDALARGTTLKWNYAEVPGIDHNLWAIWRTYANPDDTISVGEKLLFESPYASPIFLPPSADFSYVFSSWKCNEVTFKTLCADNHLPAFVYWDFGDGSTSNEYQPVHLFSDTGEFIVRLIIFNILGSDTSDQFVHITRLPPTVAFSTIDSVTFLPDAEISFINQSIHADYYYWNFGDSSFSNDVNPVHTYSVADTFTVGLLAIDSVGCGSDMIKKDLIIIRNSLDISLSTTPPTSRFYPNPLTGSSVIELNRNITGHGHYRIFIYDVWGKKVRQSDISPIGKTYFHRKDFSSGIYFFLIASTDGTTRISWGKFGVE